jgi:alpha-tubulin suppressor-like RCC1 family protein
MINIAKLELIIAEKIAKTTDTTELLTLSKAMKYLKNNNVEYVASYTNLPAAASSCTGRLIFSGSDKTLYWSDGVYWKPINQIDKKKLWIWGDNSWGQLGDGTVENRSSPVTTVGGGTNWCTFSSNVDFTSAIKADGTLWTWGMNNVAQLGDGTTINKSSPVTIAGGGTNWNKVSVGSNSTLAIKSDGTLWTFGRNNMGQLADGTTVNKSSPVTTAGGGNTWCAITGLSTAGGAIKTDGTLWMWGANTSGEVGDSAALVSRSSPVTTSGGGTNWCNISGLGLAVNAIKTDGTLWVWGINSSGRLGDGTTTNKSSPVTTAGGGTNWCSGGGYGAIKTDGTLWAWGDNSGGGLGDGTVISKSSPVTTAGGGVTWKQKNGNYAIKTDGTLWAWGSNINGYLGDGTTTNKSSPVTTAGGGSNWNQVSYRSALSLESY